MQETISLDYIVTRIQNLVSTCGGLTGKRLIGQSDCRSSLSCCAAVCREGVAAQFELRTEEGVLRRSCKVQG
jgi:hypothetical protein